MLKDLTLAELDVRLAKFNRIMDDLHPDWDTAIILSKINQYYFTGTMQDGMLVIKKGGDASFFVRRSFERARDESPLRHILHMESYRDAAQLIGKDCGNTYFETECVTWGILERLKKHFVLGKINALDGIILSARSEKTPYELNWMERSGKKHNEFLENIVPGLLREGISEADFVAELFEHSIKFGHHGVSRFSMFQSEMIVGQIGFGESSLYPTSFDGPGGGYGMCPAVPFIGSRERKLRKGDLVFVDVGFGMNGYHSDKTQVYLFGGKPTEEMLKAHRGCMDIQSRLAEQLRPGSVPAELYYSTMNSLSSDFKQNFMGYGSRKVHFLGHGIGLHIDEPPVIANGFTKPLTQNMVVALEPKKGIKGKGVVGVEDTYIVTPEGGRCITGGGKDIIVL